LQLGGGLHTGRAGLGNIGSSRRMEYTAIGDSVNLASRLEGTTKQFGVDVVINGQEQCDGWLELQGAIAPLPREDHGLAFGAARGRPLLFGGERSSYLADTWELQGADWVSILPLGSPSVRAGHALAFDLARSRLVLFGGFDGDDLGDTWFLSYQGSAPAWPAETCADGVDADGDGLGSCADPDCRGTPLCLACGDGSCDGPEHCGSCPQDCGTCGGCGPEDLRIGEVFGGTQTDVEIVNRGSCAWDAGGFTLLFRLDCDLGVQAFTFPPGSVVPPGGVRRAVERFDGSLPGETSTGAEICDTPSGEGWVMLCDGPCDLTTCGSTLDFFAKQGASAPVAPPACATFLPGPLSVTGAGAGQSATRVAFAGGGAAGLQADWSVRPVSRD
jgi:hypothetical protein